MRSCVPRKKKVWRQGKDPVGARTSRRPSCCTQGRIKQHVRVEEACALKDEEREKMSQVSVIFCRYHFAAAIVATYVLCHYA